MTRMSNDEPLGIDLPQPDFPPEALFQVPADEAEADRQLLLVDAQVEAGEHG